jgi:hypothetical protein
MMARSYLVCTLIVFLLCTVSIGNVGLATPVASTSLHSGHGLGSSPMFARKTKQKHKRKQMQKQKQKRRSHAGRGFIAGDGASTASKYGHMSNEQCEAEADVRKIPFEFEEARGVAMPVRLLSPLHGVEFRLLGKGEHDLDKVSPHDIVDCRLVLALDDFASMLQQHNVQRVVHYSMWRPPGKDWPLDKFATRHPGGLALDAARFVKADGTELDVDDDFNGKIGAKTCGEGAGPKPATTKAKEIRLILCQAVAARIFSVVLTPNYNRPHKNHFHLEIMANKNWLLVD